MIINNGLVMAFVLGPILSTPSCSWLGPGIYVATIHASCQMSYKIVALSPDYYQYTFSMDVNNVTYITTQPINGWFLICISDLIYKILY